MPNTPAPVFASVQAVDWTSLNALLSRPDLPFVDDLWHEFASVINGIEDSAHKEFACLVQAVSSFHMRLDDDETYGPAWQMDGRRALVPSDLAPQAVEVLSAVFDTCPHQDLKARIGDTVWIAGRHLPSLRRRRFDLARATVSLYVQIADLCLMPESAQTLRIAPACKRIERATQIACEINHTETTTRVDTWLATCIASRKPIESGPVCRNLLEVRLSQRFVAAAAVVAEAEVIAARLQTDRALETAGMYFDLALRAGFRTQDNELIKRCHRGCALQAIALAEAYLQASSEAWAPAAREYSRALNHLREAGAGRAEMDPVQAVLLQLNQQGAASCGSIEIPVDLTELHRHLDTLFDSTDFSEALDVFLFRTHHPKGYAHHRAEFNHAMQEFPFQMMMPMSRMSYDGRVEAVAGGAIDGDEEAVRKRVLHHVGMQQGFCGLQLKAIRRVFLDHHPMDLPMCERLAIDSPLVPRERIRSVSLAIWRGWQGRWLEAMHLLIPQLEHIIRTVLQGLGTVITVPDTEEQNYIDLGGLLGTHEVALGAVLGEGEVLALRAACTERIALNRRNDLCHGLVPDGQFGSFTDIYLWWLFQRMLLKPLFYSAAEPSTDTDHTQPEQVTP